MRTNKEIIRKNRLGRFVGPATLAFGLLVGSGVFGQIESDTFTAQWTDTDASLTLSGASVGNGLVSLPQFDDNGGLNVLQSITLRAVDVFLEGGVTFTNNGTGVATVEGADIRYASGPNSLKISGPSGFNLQFGTLNLELVAQGPTTLAIGESVRFQQVEQQIFFAPLSQTITDNSLFSPFIGLGTIDFSAAGVGSVFSGTTGGTPDQSLVSLLGRGNVEIVYEYIVIPEPGTIALFAIALGSAGGMAFIRRRKRS